MSDEVTRSEFNMLAGQVSETRTRLDTIDVMGTRGVGVIQAQLLDVTRDLTELKSDVNVKFVEINTIFSGHLRNHESEKRDRVSARRWLMGIGVAGIASMTAVISLLVELLSKVH